MSRRSSLVALLRHRLGRVVVTLVAILTVAAACSGTPQASPTAPASTGAPGTAAPTTGAAACTEEAITAAEAALQEQAKGEPDLHYLTVTFPETADKLHAAFKAKYDLTVTSTRITGAQAIARLAGDNIAGNFTNAAAIGGANPSMDALVASGDLLAITKDNAAELIPRSCQIDQRFVGTRGLATVFYAYPASQFVVNTDLVPAEMIPNSWDDLLNEFWLGKIPTQDPRLITPTLGIFEALLETYGPDFLTTYKDNVVGWHQSGATMMPLVGSGENPACWCNAATFGPFIAANPDAPVQLVDMTGPVLYSSTDVVINAKSTSQAAMRLFLSWIYSQEGQKLLNPDFRAPSIRADLTLPDTEPIPADATLLDSQKAYTNRNTILTLLGIPD